MDIIVPQLSTNFNNSNITSMNLSIIQQEPNSFNEENFSEPKIKDNTTSSAGNYFEY